MKRYNYYIFIMLASVLVATPALAVDFSNFTQICAEDGCVYEPIDNEKPAIVYADMDGDKVDEMVIAMQMQPAPTADDQDKPIDEEYDSRGWYRTFAYVYRTDGMRNPTVLLHTIPLGELLGVSIDDDHEKVIEAVDINNDGKKAVALWSTRGMHYHGLIIIGMRNGKVISLFNGGSGNQLKYEPRKNKNIIIAGDIDDSDGSGDTHIWREDVWKWNGKEFVYSKEKSSLTSVPLEQ